MSSQLSRFLIIFGVVSLAIYAMFAFPLRLGLDLKGGTHVIYQASDSPSRKVDAESISGVMDVIRNRLDQSGFNEATISKKSHDQIVVELPGVNDAERAKNLIGQTALLEFAEAEWPPPAIHRLTQAERDELIGSQYKVKDMETDATGVTRSILIGNTLLSGSDLAYASPGTSQQGQKIVSLKFSSEGAKKFYAATKQQVGKPLAILLDGKIISAPTVNEPIAGGNAQISGQFTFEEMRDLVIKLKAGALPVPIDVISSRTIGPVLGKESIDLSLKAGLIGLSLVCIFMFLAYRQFGCIAFLSLVLYVGFIMGAIHLTGVILTLPGIAGIILGIGMAVDANIIIYERIKEEFQVKHDTDKAISYGFSKAFLAILDANITTLIAAIVLYWLGTGAIKGFAITLSIGILLSMFTAIFVNRFIILFFRQSLGWSFNLKRRTS